MAAPTSCTAFVPNVSPAVRACWSRPAAAWRQGQRQQRRLAVAAAAVGDRGSRGGGAVLDRPGFETLGPGGEASTDSYGSKLDSSGGRGLGGGNWRVILMHSDKHTEEGVVKAITAVVPGTDENHAANCFHTARSLGMAIVVSVPKEHAEFFTQQLWQRGLKVGMEPDTSTL